MIVKVQKKGKIKVMTNILCILFRINQNNISLPRYYYFKF